MFFQSSSATEGVALMDECGKGVFEHYIFDLTENSSPSSVSTNFVDLPLAIQSARARGMREPVTSAMLFTHYRREAALPFPPGKSVRMWWTPPAGGVIPPSDLDDSYARELEAQFRRAAAALQAVRQAGNVESFSASSQREACETIKVLRPLGPKGEMYPVRQTICP